MNVEEEQGWVPASYLEPAEGGGAAKEASEKAQRGEGVFLAQEVSPTYVSWKKIIPNC